MNNFGVDKEGCYMLPEDEGVYIYIEGSWQKYITEGPFVPEVDGVYILYFRNIKCPGCKTFDKIWSEFISTYTTAANYAVIQCNNFFIECSDYTASNSFIFYLVFETPQVVVVVIENGTPVYIEREVGVLSMNELIDFVLNIKERMSMYLVEEPSEEGEGIYVDLSKKNWKDIVDQLKKIIFGGKIPQELCTDEGCRIVIE
ncbi:MAG: hypothetical protein QXM55_03815 [Ignisphaera sp.]